MRKTWYAVGMVVLLLGTARNVQSGEAADARAVIDKAMKALGGEANLRKQAAVTLKGSGTFYGLGEGVPFSGDWNVQVPRQLRVAMEVKVNSKAFRMIRVVNGDKGWVKTNDEAAKEMSKEQLDEERETLYTDQLATLVPLKDAAFKLAALGEARVNGRAAVGIRVSQEGHRDVSLFFDKTDGLLVKTETIVKDIEGGGKEYTQEVFQSDFKEIDGVKHAMKTLLKRDGKRFVEVEWSEIRPAEKLDDSVFAMP